MPGFNFAIEILNVKAKLYLMKTDWGSLISVSFLNWSTTRSYISNCKYSLNVQKTWAFSHKKMNWFFFLLEEWMIFSANHTHTPPHRTRFCFCCLLIHHYTRIFTSSTHYHFLSELTIGSIINSTLLNFIFSLVCYSWNVMLWTKSNHYMFESVYTLW